MIYSFQNTASQIDQTIQSAYTGLVLAGTGLVRLTGNQNISGTKTFANQVNVSGNANFSGDVSLTKIAQAQPTSDSSVDLGSTSLKFRTGFFSGVSGFTGYFDNLKVGFFDAGSLDINIDSKTGSNLTLNGTTNLNNIVVSGNSSITGNLNVTGSATLNNLNISGTVYSTGNKTFSGSLFQTGNVNISGDLILRGNPRITGSSFVSGNSTTIGNIFFTGNVNHSGGFSIKTFDQNFNFQADNTAVFGINAPVNITGTINLDGNLNITANKNIIFGNNSALSMSGLLTNSGNISGLNILSTGFISGKLIASGTSSYAGLKLYSNASNTPEIGAIEFSRNSLLFSRQTGSLASRYSVPTIYHFFTKDEIAFYFVTGGPDKVIYRFLGTTGILLDTGVYRIESSFYFRKGTTQPTIQFGFSGDENCNFTYINGYIGRILNSTDIVKNFINTNIQTGAFSGLWTGTTTTNRSGIADVTIVVTGHNHKIYPFLYSATANATGNMTGSFSMTVTQLQTGTGLNNTSFNGPWIA